MAKIKKVGHVVLGVRDPARSVKFYTEVLGMELVKVLDEMQMAFFSFGERDHDIAVIKVPDEQPVGSSGLAHTALEIEGGQEQLRELYERLKRSGARVEFTAVQSDPLPQTPLKWIMDKAAACSPCGSCSPRVWQSLP